ncbi:MAG: TIGR04084 family radical SAM/SPASM domain-containing protein [Asgard group archaeon]|nr:TIGR04084 family radical SAM/SPASM domain-containing protein [Asgard group archaeon]
MILTRSCNLKCKYCGEDAVFELSSVEVDYTMENLKKFLQQDESEITIQFYGGEPLIRIHLLEKIMDELSGVEHWSIQTNMINLHKLSPVYLRRMSSILASIDGRQETTDANRGKGVYSKVMENCKLARKNGFKGDLIARMTVSEVADIFKEVTHLAKLDSPGFNHIHWQLDSQWDDNPKARWKDFNHWINDSYNPGITKLVHWWLESMQKGKIIGLVPFIPMMKSILDDSSSTLRCGAGLDSFAINPDGTISVCPISPEFDFSIVGDIQTSTPNTIKDSMKVAEPCPSCEIFGLCGGRCLFINQTKLWGLEAFKKVCGTVEHMVSELKAIKQDVQSLIKEGIIKKTEFGYPKFNNGCEIIP